MSSRRARRDPPAEPDYQPGQLLDWRDARHWSYEQQPCRYCTHSTSLRDGKGKPAHKVCAEAALARQHAEAGEAYTAGRT